MFTFQIGQEVLHGQFGRGRIVQQATMADGRQSVDVDFVNGLRVVFDDPTGGFYNLEVV